MILPLLGIVTITLLAQVGPPEVTFVFHLSHVAGESRDRSFHACPVEPSARRRGRIGVEKAPRLVGDNADRCPSGAVRGGEDLDSQSGRTGDGKLKLVAAHQAGLLSSMTFCGR